MQASEVTDAYLRNLLAQIVTIAMIGASPRASRPSNGVMRYLQAAGYRVIPVNPALAGGRLLGEKAYASLADIPDRFELVDVFRRPEAVAGIVEQVIPLRQSRGILCLWLQPGVVDEAAAERARAAGIDVVMDRCLKAEHGRLTRIARDV